MSPSEKPNQKSRLKRYSSGFLASFLILAGAGVAQVTETGDTLRLTWDANSEADLSHYNVYCNGELVNPATLEIPIAWHFEEVPTVDLSVTSGLTVEPESVKVITESKTVVYTEVNGAKITTPEFVHSGLSAGIYTYTVTAVDESGNESEHSNSAGRLVLGLSAPEKPKGLR